MSIEPADAYRNGREYAELTALRRKAELADRLARLTFIDLKKDHEDRLALARQIMGLPVDPEPAPQTEGPPG